MVAKLVPTVVGYHKCTCAPTRIRDTPIINVLQTTCSGFSQFGNVTKRADRRLWHCLAFAGHSPTLSERWVWARKEEEGWTTNKIGGTRAE